MIQELYQKSLMRLAANATGAGSMESPDAEGTLDNPTCGDRITIQVKLDDGRITELVHENRSCMLCQASASLLAQNAIGMTLQDVTKIQEEIKNIFETGEIAEDPSWSELEYFVPVKDHKSRHICVLLPLNALNDTLQTVK